MQSDRNFGLHIGELLLNKLIGGKRTAELLAIEYVLAGAMPAEFRGAHGAPGNAITGAIETAERACKAFHVRQQVFLRDHAVGQHDLAGNGRAQGELAFNLWRGKTLGAALDQKTTDDVVELRPHDR